MSAEYEVGYKKPPTGARFEKGRSGNPKGRPKGSQNLATVIRRELLRPVRILENGKKRTVTRVGAVAAATAAKAMGGDTKAAKLVLELAAKHLPNPPPGAAENEHPPVAPVTWTEEDAKLAKFLREVPDVKVDDDEPQGAG